MERIGKVFLLDVTDTTRLQTPSDRSVRYKNYGRDKTGLVLRIVSLDNTTRLQTQRSFVSYVSPSIFCSPNFWVLGQPPKILVIIV